MKTSTTAKRLAEYMSIYQKRQVDLLDEIKPYCEEFGVKINKSEISQYLSGKFEPGNKKIFAMSVALGINPMWLMGYDEPMYNTDNQERVLQQEEADQKKPDEQNDGLYQKAAELLLKLTPKNQEIFMRLTPQNIDRLFGYAERLLEEQTDEPPARE